MKMKKIIAAVSSFVLLCGAFVMPVSAAEAPNFKKGDVDMNGEVTAIDAQLVLISYLNFVMNGNHTLLDEQLVLADVYENKPVNSDGNETSVTASDAQFILKMAADHLVE